MAAVTGFGGAFLRAKDPQGLYAWYERHLGLRRQHGTLVLSAAEPQAEVLISFFRKDDPYFPVDQSAMLNLRVDDLHALLDRLSAEGVLVDPKREHYGYGDFGWLTDPEGNRVELWQPAAG